MVGSTSASIPSRCATTMRSSHCWVDCGVDMQAESHTMMLSTRSGCCSASPSAVAPPIDSPPKLALPMPSASIRATASAISVSNA